MANYKVLANWDISIQNLYKDITLIQQGISCKLNISLRSISRVTVNYKVGNEYVTDLCTIDLDNNKVIVPFKKNVLEVGTHALELVCHMKNGDVLPTPNYSYTVTKSLTNDNDITEEDAYPVLIGMIQELTEKENVIQANEEARANAEMYRELNEDERQNAEAERKRNENIRVSNENTRQSNESSRQQYETQRRAEEDERLTDEQVRVNAENIRIANENERLRKEIERQNAEELRQIAYNSSLYARMDEAEEQLNNKGFINIKDYGAKGDGETDDTKVIQDAIDSGKNVYIPNGTYVITSGLKVTNSSLKVFGDGASKSILKYKGRGTNGDIISIKGMNADDCISNITLKEFGIDAIEQWFKGGNSDESPTITSSNPRYAGLKGISILFAKNIIIEDVLLNDIYGDGIHIKRSSHCTINRCSLYDCSSGNIHKNGYTGWDNHGDGIVAFMSYNIDITNNVVINKRTYMLNETQNNAYNDVYGLPCGRSGLEFEYRINSDAPSDNPNDPNYNAPGYSEFDVKDGFGLRLYNNYVYGYTKGVHLESGVRCIIDSNKIIKNHIGILHTGGNMVNIINNYISNEGLTECPQIGYNNYSGGIALTEYGTPSLTLVSNNIIDISAPLKRGVTIGRGNVRVINNSIQAYSGVYDMKDAKGATRGVFILNNEFKASQSSSVLIYKYYKIAEWIIEGNVFTDPFENSSSYIRLDCDNQNYASRFSATVMNNVFRDVGIKLEGYASSAIISYNTFNTTSDGAENFSTIVLPRCYNINIDNNKFYINSDSNTQYCIKGTDSTTHLNMIGNSFYIESNFIKTISYLPNYQTYLKIIDNKIAIPTDSEDINFIQTNWEVAHPQIIRNKFIKGTPYLNNIIKSTASQIAGNPVIENNIGKINTSITNSLLVGTYYSAGCILKDYSSNAAKTSQGQICVKSGVYAKISWAANTSYSANSFIINDNKVYKVITAFTSSDNFETTNLKDIGSLCVFKTLSL